MLDRVPKDKVKKHTTNLGLRNSVTSCRLEKWISSGSLWSSRFSFVFLPFLLAAVVPVPGRLIPAPFVAGAKRSFVSSLRLLSQGVRKSIRTVSFFERVFVVLAAAASASAALNK